MKRFSAPFGLAVVVAFWFARERGFGAAFQALDDAGAYRRSALWAETPSRRREIHSLALATCSAVRDRLHSQGKGVP